MAKRKAAASKDDAGSGTNEPFEAISDGRVNIGKSTDLKEVEVVLLRLANRHGLVTGATGTGKTVTLQGLAEGFSDQGVPVFCADVDRRARQGDQLHAEFPRLPGDLLGPVR